MLHRTRFEHEYARLYEPPTSYGTTIWSPLACGLLSGKYGSKSIEGGEGRLGGGSGVSTWLRESLKSGEGMNGLEERNIDRVLDIVDKLRPIAERLGGTLAQLALAWAAKNPNVSTVITGASRASQVTENFKALTLLPKLTPEVMAEIEAVLGNQPKKAHDWTKMN